MPDGTDETAKITFRVDEEMRDDFDMVILQKKAAGELDPNASRSDVLRDLVDEYVEGNETILNAPAQTTAD